MQRAEYKLDCACCHAKRVEAADMGSSGFIVWRHVCDVCGTVTYPLFKAPRARADADLSRRGSHAARPAAGVDGTTYPTAS